LPEFPLITEKAKKEIKQVCVPRNRCDEFNYWLTDVYMFAVKYYIYKEKLPE
jgi:hypothetical protein